MSRLRSNACPPNCDLQFAICNLQFARNSGRRRCGFTLLELLVGLTIGAILAASLFTSLYVGFKAKERAEAAVAPTRTAELAMELIRADLAATQPLRGILEGPFEGAAGAGPNGGEGDTLTFYSNGFAPVHPSANGEIKQVTLLLEQRDNDTVLVRQVVGNLLSQQQVVPDEEVICRNVASFTLRYFDGQEWQQAWDSTQYGNALPTAVEVTLEIRRTGADAKAPPIHLRRVFALACVSEPDYGGSSSGTTPSSSGASAGSGSGSGSGSGAKAGGK